MRKSKLFIGAFLILIVAIFVGYKYKDITEVKRELTKEDGVVFLTYTNSSSMFNADEDYFEYYTEIDTNGIFTEKTTKNITIPNKELPSVSRQLSKKELNRLYQLIDNYNLLHMDNDLSTDSDDGSYTHLTFTLTDGTKYSVGGLNPSNRRFCKVVDYILSLYNDEMEKELTSQTEAYYSELKPNFLYYKLYNEIKKYDLDITESQLEMIANTSSFFADIENLSKRDYYTYGGEYNTETNSVTAEGYSINSFENYIDIYVGNTLVGKVDKLDYTVIYESTIKQYGLHVSEDQLRSVDIDGFFFDLDQICSEVDYFSTSSKYNYDNMSFTGDGYSLLKKDDKWVIYIADSIVGEVDYISPREKYKDGIKAYHLTLSDKELC
ncbi:MAG TPA: hypothetical protein VHP81_11845, partial [Lachnospiraceae bacterium]|nr:hypothetical protein [Lachnospiraceae bacterium]